MESSSRGNSLIVIHAAWTLIIVVYDSHSSETSSDCQRGDIHVHIYISLFFRTRFKS